MRNEEENWLEDAFNEKKDQELNDARMGGSSKLLIGCGCLGAVILTVIFIVSSLGLLSALSAA